MAFTPLQADVNSIENLGTDKPNEDLGLSGLQLRQKFDAAGTAIKNWINKVFLEEIAGTGGAANIGITQIGSISGYDVQSALQGLYDMENETRETPVTNDKLSSELKIPTDNIADDAVVEGKVADGAITATAAGTLYVASWNGEDEPYTQTVTVEMLKTYATYTPRLGLNASETYATAILEKEGWGYIVDADVDSEAGTITFRASSKPEVDLNFTCEVNKR